MGVRKGSRREGLMSKSMLSRMTEDICIAMCGRIYTNELMLSHDLARAALVSLSQPDATMNAAGGLKCKALLVAGSPKPAGVISKDIAAVFHAMIASIDVSDKAESQLNEDPLARKPLTAVYPSGQRLASIGWAMSHAATRDAYTRCTGEDVGPILDRYQAWLDENIIGDAV